MNRSARGLAHALVALVVLSAVRVTDAETIPTPGLTDPRIRTAAYQDDVSISVQF